MVRLKKYSMDKDFFSLLLTVFFLAFGMSFVAPLIPLLLKTIGASSATIGQISTVYFLSFTVATLLLGRWIDHVGSKKLIVAGLIIFGLAILIMPFAPSPLFFYTIRIFQGIGSSLLFAPTETAINIISPPEKRASNMGIYGLAFAIGFAMGPGIGATLYAINTILPFAFGALCCVAAAIVMIAGFHETQIPIKKTSWGFFHLLGPLKISITAGACYAVVEVSMGTFLSLYLDAIDIGGTALGIVFTFFAVGGAVSPFPAGKIADKYGKRRVLKVCGLVLVAVTFSYNVFQSYWIICLLTFCIGLVAGALYPVALSLIGELIPIERMGAANASFSFFYGLGSIFGPLITGWIVELFSIQYLFLPMSVSALIFLAFTMLDNYTMKRPMVHVR